MANAQNNQNILNTVSPNLPIAPVEYSQTYQDQLNNAQRLYYVQNDNNNQLYATSLYSQLTISWLGGI